MSLTWHIYTDGGARGNPGPAAIGVHVVDDQGNDVFRLSKYLGDATNNEAEYQAVSASLEWLIKTPLLSEVERIEWYLDSMLVVEQLNKHWKIKEPRLQVLATHIWQQLSTLSLPHTFAHVRREKNKVADALVNQALDATTA